MYDDDEFDVFSRDHVDVSRVRRGKKYVQCDPLVFKLRRMSQTAEETRQESLGDERRAVFVGVGGWVSDCSFMEWILAALCACDCVCEGSTENVISV